MSITLIPKTVIEQLRLVKSQDTGALQPVGVVRMDTVEVEPIEWLWQPFIARKKLTAMTGEEGVGKSWITAALASIVSHGGWFPNCAETRVEAETVLFLAAEDGIADTLKPRLNAVGANQSRVFVVTDYFSFDELGLLRFYNLVAELRPALVIIDPFFSYLEDNLNINLSTAIRPITSKLARIAEEFNAAFLLVRHIGKSRGMGEARAAGLGSIDFRAVCRSELLVGKNPDNARECAIVQIKNNLAEYGTSVGYQIRGGKLFFNQTELTAEQLLSGAKNEDERNSQKEAVVFLREILFAGEKSAREIKAEAIAYGLTEQMLRTARSKLGIKPYKRGNQFGLKSVWYWRIEKDSSAGEA